MREGGATAADRARFAFRLATARAPKEDELEKLTSNFFPKRNRGLPRSQSTR